MKTFWFHYNKVASRKAGRPQITVHYNRICHLVDFIICNVPTHSKINKRQPYFVMKGKCAEFLLTGGNDQDKIAHIY